MRLAPASIKVHSTYSSSLLAPQIELLSARGEFEPFQVVVDNDGAADLEKIEIEVDLHHGTQPFARILPATVYRLEMVDLANQSSQDAVQSPTLPDPLIPIPSQGRSVVGSVVEDPAGGMTEGTWEIAPPENFRTVPRSTRALFLVDLFIPADAEAGMYSGQVVVLHTPPTTPPSPRTQLATLPIELEVDPFELPLKATLKSLFMLSPDAICRGHGLHDGTSGQNASGFCPDSTAVALWSRLYGRLLLEHRITPSLDHAPIASVPQTIDEPKSATDYFMKYGEFLFGSDPLSVHRVNGRSPPLTVLNYPWWIREVDKSTNPPTILPATPNNANENRAQSWQNVARTQLMVQHPDRQLLSYLTDDDEPNASNGLWTMVQRIATVMHGTTPRSRHLVTTDIDTYAANGGTASDQIDIITPMLLWLDDDGSNGFASTNRRPNYAFFASPPSRELWGYQSCNTHGCGGGVNNRPNLMVDATAIQNRAEPWMHFLYDTTGILYWNISYRLNRAWETGTGLWAFNGNGDGTLVYPGTPPNRISSSNTPSYPADRRIEPPLQPDEPAHHLPLPSLRLKMIREGMEDYEYLAACHQRDPVLAREIASHPTTGLFTRISGTPQTPHGSMFRVNNAGASPPPGVLSPEQMVAQLEAARRALLTCIALPPPVVPPTEWADDPGVVSPPRIGATVVGCGLQTPQPSSTVPVNVVGVIPGSTVEIFHNIPPASWPFVPPGSTPVHAAVVNETTALLSVPLPSIGGVDMLFARQTTGGATSRLSDGANVAWLAGDPIPRPLLQFHPFHTCGRTALTHGAFPGAVVNVFSSTVGWQTETVISSVTHINSGLHGHDFSATPLLRDRWISTTADMCGQTSSFHASKIEDFPASTLTPPTVSNCETQFGKLTQCIKVGKLVPGATVRVTWPSLPAGISGPIFEPSQELANIGAPDSETLTVDQFLCAGSTSPSVTFDPTRKACTEMPAPEFATPHAGDDRIELTKFVPGARFHVFVSSSSSVLGSEIGDSTDTIILLSQNLAAGDFVRVFQEKDGCIGGASMGIQVGFGP